MQQGKGLAIARGVTLAAAVFAVALLIASGPGTRGDAWPWEIGLILFVIAGGIGAIVAVASILLLAVSMVPRWRRHPWMPLAALCLAIVAVAPPFLFVMQARVAPPIHDITTDPDDPPQFVALRAERGKSPNGFEYGGPKVAAEQRVAYPDIKPLEVSAPPREEMQRAIDAARAMGWEVVASDAQSGRIEATARTLWFGFSDDIVVRIRPQGTGSRVDVRSASRVGLSDVGANAARIRKYLGKLA
ncbi:MAG TPA: DUF1499 domain-containing protein [Usitatibacter sp.]|nr:DUF1499 domain-containing protein [Usitatibacter sp.]